MNKQVRDLKDEIFHLPENPSEVAELVRKAGKSHALTSNDHEGKFLVSVDVDISGTPSGKRVAL